MENFKSSCHQQTEGSHNGIDVFQLLSLKSERKFSNLFTYISETAKELGGDQVFYTLDFADILWKLQLWKEKLPNVRMFYAVKVNSDPVLLQLFAALGVSFECASEAEIRLVLKAGGAPENITFSHPIKTSGGLKYAKDIGVNLAVFDNEDELLKIHSIYPDTRLLLRVCPEDIHCHFDLSSMFGCTMKEAQHLLSRAKMLSLNVVGLAFHVGALCTNPISYVSTIRNCSQIFRLAEEMGFNLKILDIGGGFLGGKNCEDSFRQAADAINGALEKYFPGNDVKLFAEPGYYVVGSALNLVTTILGKRNVENRMEDNGMRSDIKRHYYINESVFGSFYRDVHKYDNFATPLLKDSEIRKRRVHKSIIFGQSCSSKDMLHEGCLLPDMKIGECLLWQNMGAYGPVSCSRFCGMPLPIIRYIFQENSRLNLSWIDVEKVLKLLKGAVVLIQNDEDSKKSQY